LFKQLTPVARNVTLETPRNELFAIVKASPTLSASLPRRLPLTWQSIRKTHAAVALKTRKSVVQSFVKSLPPIRQTYFYIDELLERSTTYGRTQIVYRAPREEPIAFAGIVSIV
jgi:hypothetical protein